MMKLRIPKPDDQQNAERAMNLLNELVSLNPDIEPNVWVSACLSAIACTYYDNCIPYEDYKKEMHEAIEHYSKWW